MKVADDWFDCCNGSKLHDSKIAFYDESNAKWMLQLDSEKDHLYAMQ